MKNSKIKIYTDAGADISFLKPHFESCDFCTFPYDSDHRRKKSPKPRLACPSKAQWGDCHAPWNEINFTWADFAESSLYQKLEKIVGPGNRRDILHLDSAHKEGVDIFLTSDKDDIWGKRCEIEQIINFKIYHTPSEQNQILDAFIRIRADS